MKYKMKKIRTNQDIVTEHYIKYWEAIGKEKKKQEQDE
tara:strand:- start:565 stop:678 length:114 start_codon:yes stop_codon:yes gene_type:complete